MKYVKIEPIMEDGRQKGYSLDADPYLRALPDLLNELPEGGRGFAANGDHYFFFGRKCVKDLKLSRVSLMDDSDRLSVDLVFSPNQFKHDVGLVIQYENVVEFQVKVTATGLGEASLPETKRLGYVQLDEILPHGSGLSHEVQMTGGSLWIVARDLSFEWRDQDLVGQDRTGP